MTKKEIERFNELEYMEARYVHIVDKAEELLSRIRAEHHIASVSYEVSFWQKLYCFGMKPYELLSFDNYLFSNYKDIWDLTYYMRKFN